MKDEDDNDDWLEGNTADDESDVRAPVGGVVVSKAELHRITGLAPATIDRLISDGMPVEAMGVRRTGWKINTAKVFDWFWRRKVVEATGGNPAGVATFDAAKRRDKEAQARLRELSIAQKEGELIAIEDVEKWAAETLGVIRSRFLAVESQVVGLDDDQREQLRSAIHDAFVSASTFKREGTDDNDASGDSPQEGA